MAPQDKNTRLADNLKRFSDVRVLGLLAFGIIAVLITWSGLKTAKVNYELEKQISQLQQRNSVEKLENENLQLKNEYYKSDQYLELAARSKFNKAAVGERLYLIPKSVELVHTLESPVKAKRETTRQHAKQKSKYQENFDAWMEFLFSPGSDI
jgi:cell division protein FtsB